jgi:hypothetical protein
MEQNQNPDPATSLFQLNLDAQSKYFLTESAKWGKFLAVIGFIICGLIVLGGIFMISQLSENRTFNNYGYRNEFQGFGPVMIFVYILVAVIYFFPCLYLLRFSNHMKTALAGEDQANLVASFRNLKSMFKFVGVFTIILISLYILAFLIAVMSRV